MRHLRTTTMLAAALAATLVAGCGGAANSADPGAANSAAAASTEHNDADVAFVQGMIPHHRQAVEMSKIASGRAASPRVQELATQIEQAQGPEIDQMRGFLRTWQAPESGSMGGMSGMMNPAQMQGLGQATGTEFDRMFLRMMIEHHTGAIEMARTELVNGRNAEAKGLARKIADAQQSEISTMQELLRTL